MYQASALGTCRLFCFYLWQNDGLQGTMAALEGGRAEGMMKQTGCTNYWRHNA
jgi:hypothetical protein